MKRPSKGRKRKARIMLKTGARIVEKGTNALRYPKAPTRLAADVGANFKIRIRHK